MLTPLHHRRAIDWALVLTAAGYTPQTVLRRTAKAVEPHTLPSTKRRIVPIDRYLIYVTPTQSSHGRMACAVVRRQYVQCANERAQSLSNLCVQVPMVVGEVSGHSRLVLGQPRSVAEIGLLTIK